MSSDFDKDTTLSTVGDRDASRSSITGSDDKFRAVDNKVDIGEAENTAAVLSNKFGADSSLAQLAGYQALRFAEELQDRRIRRDDELATIRQRQLTNAADHDQNMRELSVAHAKSRNSQDVRHADLATDRQWNIDEQAYAVAKVVEALGVDHRIAFATVLESLASVAKSSK